MLDMSWGELMLIGGVALIAIPPKDLPKALRTLGQMTGKVRRLASEFQAQFNEAIREAELDSVKRDLDAINRDVRASTAASFNPIQTLRDEIKTAVESRPTASSVEPTILTSSPDLAMAEIAASHVGPDGAGEGSAAVSAGPAPAEPEPVAADTAVPIEAGGVARDEAPAHPVGAIDVAPLTEIAGPGLEGDTPDRPEWAVSGDGGAAHAPGPGRQP